MHCGGPSQQVCFLCGSCVEGDNTWQVVPQWVFSSDTRVPLRICLFNSVPGEAFSDWPLKPLCSSQHHSPKCGCFHYVQVEFFGQQLEGMAFTQHGWVQSYGSRYVRPPLIVGDIKCLAPMTVAEFKVKWNFLGRAVFRNSFQGRL